MSCFKSISDNAKLNPDSRNRKDNFGRRRNNCQTQLSIYKFCYSELIVWQEYRKEASLQASIVRGRVNNRTELLYNSALKIVCRAFPRSSGARARKSECVIRQNNPFLYTKAIHKIVEKYVVVILRQHNFAMNI